MQLNRSNIELVFQALKASFNNAYASAATVYAMIALEVSSTTAIEEYPWLSNFPQMREWVDERHVKQLEAYSYSLKNEDHEATIEIDKNDFSDDRLGMYAAQMRGAGETAGRWPDEMVIGAVNNAFDASKGKCWDGKAFFADDHPLSGKKTFDNQLAAALKADTQANAEASFGKAEVALMEMADPEGRPLGLMPKILLVPPALKATANILMKADRLDDKPNPYKGSAEVVCSSRLTSKTAWFLLGEGPGGLKPFLWQLRQAPEIEMITDPQHPAVFNRRKLPVGVHARGAAGYTLPQLAVGSTGTG
ncbi:MAG: Mu-like prophage major head subunit gpT family protein [Bryobacterales bacterium]|nr:Mu-like prophage major head subunit gpT family protein [Bryobacterales bacterium]